MSNITTQLALWQCLCGTHGLSSISSFIDWILLASRAAWLNEEHLPGQVRPWKSVKDIQQNLRELRMRQVSCVPIFKGPDPDTFTAGMKLKFSSSPPASDMGQ